MKVCHSKAPPAAGVLLWFLFKPLWSAVTLSGLLLFTVHSFIDERLLSSYVSVMDWAFIIFFSSKGLNPKRFDLPNGLYWSHEAA